MNNELLTEIIEKTVWSQEEGRLYCGVLAGIAVAHSVNTVLEFGTRFGLSAYAWNSTGADLFTIDVEECRFARDKLPTKPSITFLRGDCVETAQQLLKRETGIIDLCYLDAEHSYDGVIKEFCCVVEYCRLIVIHDTIADERAKKAVGMLELDYWDRWKFCTLPHLNGITVATRIDE